MQVLEENSTNWLVMTATGTTTKTKSSSLNQLLYGHDLFGLLDVGDEIWQSQGAKDEPSVTIIPGEDAKQYTIKVEDAPDLNLGAHHKTDLVDAMIDHYEEHQGMSVAPILDLYEDVRENMVREKVLDPFLDMFSGKVAGRDDGWFINGHLLLTYEGDFYHPNHVSRNRSGSIIGRGTSVEAYNLEVDPPTADMQRNITVDGEKYRLTNSEVEFVAKALWAVKNAPDRT